MRTHVATRVNARRAPNSEALKQRLCEQCGEPYAPKKPTQRFCTTRCRSANWGQFHPRVAIGPVKLEGKPTAEQLAAAGISIRRRA